MNIKRLIIFSTILILSSCATVQPLSSATEVLGMPAKETALIVTEEFNHDGNTLPSGIYYPALQVTNGYVIYHFAKPINVKTLWIKDTCSGGIAVNQIDPYNKYHISVRNCFGDPNIRIDIPGGVKFKIGRAK